MKTPEQMIEAFKDFPEAIENSQKIEKTLPIGNEHATLSRGSFFRKMDWKKSPHRRHEKSSFGRTLIHGTQIRTSAAFRRKTPPQIDVFRGHFGYFSVSHFALGLVGLFCLVEIFFPLQFPFLSFLR